MTKEQIQTYTLRITQADKTEIIIILYDMILDDIIEAENSYQNNDYSGYKKACNHITRCTADLVESLEFEYDISYNLMSLYLYVNKEVATAVIKNNPISLKNAEYVIKNLKEVFIKVCELDESGPVMKNTQTVYAGLTYGKNNLAEDLRDQGSSRGFRV